MFRKLSLTILGCSLAYFSFAQKGRDSLAIDTTFYDYDELISELDHLIDSLMTPHSFTLVNLGISQNYLTFESKTQLSETKRRVVYSPSFGYFDKSGYGISGGATAVNDGSGLNAYQYSVTGSFDFQKKKAFLAGVSLTHFFTRKDLPFYVSPLQNEAGLFFIHRKLWFKPSVAFSYGWGSRDSFEEVEEKIQNINLVQRGFTRINTNEKVVDLNLVASVRHDFYFLDVLGSNYIRITPQLSFTSGSQQFGFNQTANSYATLRRSGNSILYNTENVTFDNSLYFQPLSATGFLKAEYAKGKFFLQPQVMFDYYFPATTNHFNTAFVLNTGFVF